MPVNELQIPILPIVGDIGTLPHFGQWAAMELLEQELLGHGNVYDDVSSHATIPN